MTALGAADDARLMGLALALGRRQLGLTWPNPAVGAVVIDGTGRIIGTGATARGGRPHAEPIALQEAGDASRGATLFVSLEPCSHHGKTPPCAEAIVRAGIARVVSALEDPDRRVAGRGHAILRAAGTAVEVGVLSACAARDHRGHVTRVRLGRPAVTLKLARTLDGFAADPDTSRLLISGEGANARTHMLRAHADAVAVGVATVLADDPRLDVRLPGLEDRSPVRIVFDSHLRLPLEARLVTTAGARPTWVVCTDEADVAREGRLAESGVQVLRIASDGRGRIDLAAALRALGSRGITRLFCEGGPTLADALAKADLVDELVVITASHRLGRPGLPAIGAHLGGQLAATMRLSAEERVGPDVIARYERTEPCSPAS